MSSARGDDWSGPGRVPAKPPSTSSSVVDKRTHAHPHLLSLASLANLPPDPSIPQTPPSFTTRSSNAPQNQVRS
eukprot:9493986-Pyramimonas_sp.AAC.1